MQQRPSGHVYRHSGRRGDVWRAKYRLPDGRQVHRTIGPASTQRGRPPAGHFTKRTAEDWLRETLDQAQRGTLPGMLVTGATFADAAAEFLRYVEHDRRRKPSTIRDYRSVIDNHLLSAFAGEQLEDLTFERLDRWAMTLGGDRAMSNRQGSWAATSTPRRCCDGTRRRCAGLRPLRFHDLRHTLGTTMIARADILRVKEWMGHADVDTTMKYLHYAPRPQDAALVAEAFAVDLPAAATRVVR